MYPIGYSILNSALNKTIASALIVFVSAVLLFGIFVPETIVGLLTKPGISIEFLFIDEKGQLIADYDHSPNMLDKPLIPGKLYVQVRLITPPTYKTPEITIYKGFVEKPKLFIPLEGEFRKAVEDWVKWLSSRRTIYGYDSGRGVIIDAWLFGEDGYVRTYTRIVSIHPVKLLMNKVEEYSVTLSLIGDTLYKYSIKNTDIKPYDACWIVTEWIPQWTISTDEISEYMPYKVVDGVKYIETPVLIVDNAYYRSGVVNAWINIEENAHLGVSLTIGAGTHIEDKVDEGKPVEEIGFTMTKLGYTWEETVKSFARSLILYPEEIGYIYIYTRPVIVFEKEAYVQKCSGSPDEIIGYTGNERIRVYLQDVLVEDSEIIGGSKKDKPSKYFMNAILDGQASELEYVTRLEVDESVSFTSIINTYQQCDQGFGIPLGIGAIASEASGAFAYLLSTMQVSFERGGALVITGGIQNYGKEAGVGYDIYENIYVRVSKASYMVKHCIIDDIWCSYCYYRMPVALYIKSA